MLLIKKIKENSLNNLRIDTNRLKLIPFSLEICKALLERNHEILRDLGLNSGEGWPSSEILEILPMFIELIENEKGVNGFGAWLIIKKESMTVIGDAGFKGSPNSNGEVDVGYSIVENERNKGYGYETVNALVDWVFSKPEVTAVTADCDLNNIGSIKILKKLGMSEVSRDEENIYWKRHK